MGVPKTVSLDSPWGVAVFALVGMLFVLAYRFRLHSINEIGPVIHDFDAQFNYRATEYLYQNGWHKFFTWFDDMSWYPLGRPVGSTIYPGLQITAVLLKTLVLRSWSIVEICCYIPAWFGGVGSMLVGLIAYESVVSQEKHAHGSSLLAIATGTVAMAMMAIIPAHLLRCVGGKFDNESVAMSAMLATFFCWIRSLRNDGNKRNGVLYSVLSGVFYFYMAAAWGGHIFALNLIGFHAAVSVLLGRFAQKMYRSYSLFYVVGTMLAMQIPVIGWTPIISLEQLGPCLVFLEFQVLRLCQILMNRRKEKLSKVERLKIYFKVFFLSFLLTGIATAAMYQHGIFARYIIPVQTRVQTLFSSKKSSGNPLVDGVAEHQPTESDAYTLYLGVVGMIAPLGCLQLLLFHWKNNDTTTFLICWGLFSYAFSQKMHRLVTLASPVACVLAALCVSRLMMWSIEELLRPHATEEDRNDKENEAATATSRTKSKHKRELSPPTRTSFEKVYYSKEGEAIKRFMSLLIPIVFLMLSEKFYSESADKIVDLSNPTIVFKAQSRGNRGDVILVKDYIESSEWIRDNTPADARVLAWWPHGYRLAAIANRTTLADGNTWSHDHLALLGLVFTADIEKGHDIVRHLADYVVISAGGAPDDIGRGNYMARIAHSVYRDHCRGDPACRYYSFMDSQRTPSPKMKQSMLYQLSSHDIRPDVHLDPAMFEEVYRSKFGKMRVFKIVGVSSESKEWVSNTSNRLCDTGKSSWICRGQYPPALEPLMSTRVNFESDDEYKRDYIDSLINPRRPKYSLPNPNQGIASPQKNDINSIYHRWEDTEQSGLMWKSISSANIPQLKSLLSQDSSLAFVRSKDGRGPMWWAFENGNEEIIRLLISLGVPHKDIDGQGLSPVDFNPDLATKIINPKEYEKSAKKYLYSRWEDSEQTDLMWKLISSGDAKQVKSLLNQDSKLAFVRSKDGRGPMWWAFEVRNEEIIRMLNDLGVPHTDKDANGNTPVDFDSDFYSKVLNPKEYETTEKNALYNRWEDSEQAGLMWNTITSADVPQVESLLNQDSKLAFVRSKDGRGPMWWAFEAGSMEIIKMLLDLGVPTSDKDVQGVKPEQLFRGDDKDSFLAKVMQ